MKRVLIIALVLMLIPCMATATMTSISDLEMEEVTAQRGISIAPLDINLDLRIENIAYIDADSGSAADGTGRSIVGVPTSYTQGVLNITGLQIDNLHATLAGTIVADGAGEVGGAFSNASVFAEPITIDVETYASNATIVALRDKTMVAIGMADLSLTIDTITIDNISLDTDVATVSVGGFDADGDGTISGVLEEGILNPGTGLFDFTGSTLSENSLGSVVISGLKLRMYSNVGGFDTTTGAPVNPGHRSVVMIFAH